MNLNAVENNNRLFPPFARKLSQNDPTVYTTFTDKLAIWLASERAYYPAARPEIVNLLLTAYATLRRAVAADNNVPFHISTCIAHPMTAPYARLLKAVHPHRELFVEPELQGRIRQLLRTVSITIPADTLNEIALPNSLLSPVNGQTPLMQFSSSSLSSALQMRSSSTYNMLSPALPKPLLQAPAMMPSTAANPGSTLSFDLSNPPYSSIPTLSPQHTQAFHPVASTETALHELNSASPVVVHLGESTTTNSASRKKKRRPKFELASLVAKDLEELSRKRAIKQEPVGDVDSLLEMARPNGTPVFTSPAGEASVGSSSICLADIKTSGVVSTDASSINVGTKHDHGPVREASRSNTASDPTRDCKSGSMEIGAVTNIPNGSTSLSTNVPGVLGGGEYPHTQDHGKEASWGDLRSTPPDDVNMMDEIGLVPGGQEEHTAVSTSFIPGEINADMTYDASGVDHEMLEDTHEDRHGTGAGTGDGVPAQGTVSGPGEQPTGVLETKRLTTGSDSDTLAHFPPSAPNTVLSSGMGEMLPSRMPTALASAVPEKQDRNHEPEPTASSSTNGGKHFKWDLGEIGILGSHDASGYDPKGSFVGQSGRTVDERVARVPPAPSPPDHGPQLPTATSTDDIRHVFSNADQSLEVVVPVADAPAMLDTATTSSASTTSKQTTQKNIALSSSTGPAISLAPNNVLEILPKNSNAFGGKMRILAVHRGLSGSGGITIRFDIPEEQLPAFRLWKNRKNVKEGLQESLCISLACYPSPVKNGERKTVDQLSALPSCWPKKGGMTMNVLYEGRREEFSLSPPFMVAANGLVDVSEFLSPGTNAIELNHRLDMSAYIFVLRAHSPTHGQLEEVAQRHVKKQEWQEWLRHVSRPLDVSLPSFS